VRTVAALGVLPFTRPTRSVMQTSDGVGRRDAVACDGGPESSTATRLLVPRFPFRDAVSYTVAVDPRLTTRRTTRSSPTDLADINEFERLTLERPPRRATRDGVSARGVPERRGDPAQPPARLRALHAPMSEGRLPGGSGCGVASRAPRSRLVLPSIRSSGTPTGRA